MIAKFIDTHCHFDFPLFSDQLNTSLAQAQNAGITDIIIPAVCEWNLQRIIDLSVYASQHNCVPKLHAALGLHPLYIADHSNDDLDTLTRLLEVHHDKCVAIGEIGLDLYMDNPQFDKQTALLKTQLKLAKRFSLPVILHSRKSHDQLAALLRRHDVPRKGVVHGFAGSLSQAQAFINLGYYIGVGGTISYERAQKTRHVIAQLPLTALVLETDAPDMPLAGFQGQANRPERIADIFTILCSLRTESADEIANQLYENSNLLFSI